MANVLSCNIVESKFEFWSRYYVYFHGKSMNLFIIPAEDWIVPLLFFYKDDFGIKPTKLDMLLNK